VPLLDSFFEAMIRLDGDRLVMQVGQKPYVVRAASMYSGPVEWGQVELSTRPLTRDAALAMLEQILPREQLVALAEIGAVEHELAPPDRPGERFVVVAARGGDDVWVEVKRLYTPPPVVVEPVAQPEGVREPEVAQKPEAVPEPARRAEPEPPAMAVPQAESVSNAEPAPMPEPVAEAVPEEPVVEAAAPPPPPAVLETTPAAPEAILAAFEPATDPPAERPSVVVPMSRPAPKGSQTPHPVERLLRAATAAGAASIHLTSGTRPMARINGQIRPLDTEPVTAHDIEKFLDARGIASDGVWEGELADVGRIRCIPVNDYRGAALTIQLVPPGLLTADHLGLSEPVQALTHAADGLVLIAGRRASGKSTLVNAFIDVINRTRYDYVITVEARVAYVHDSQHSIISQREVRGEGDAYADALRSALREGPDVLIIDDLRAPEAAVIAIDAARAGRLVFATIAAPSVEAAIDRLLEPFAAVRQPQVRALLSGILRGVIVQTLVKSAAGPMIAAREILLNPPPGSESMTDTLVQLVRDGRVNAMDALRAAPDRDAVAAALQREGFETDGERLA